MQKIEAKTLHMEVTSRLRGMIRSGELSRGQKIDEKHLSELMGVSRTPVREALRVLHSEGVVDLIPYRGAYVTQPSIEEIRDLFDVMGVLEGTCAKLAALRMAEEDLKKIHTLHRSLERHFLRRDHEAYLETNHYVHLMIQELSGNKVLNDVLNGLRQKVLLYRHRQLYYKDRFEKSMQEHRLILEALQECNPSLAEEVMKKHLSNQCEALVDLYSPEQGEADHQRAA
ncbi:MAG: GntR family transcriptional regulator [Deltaproteobacteria bacterium]|nr:GntR family transcriptional regulator [Deltaproteobacteria bacterium]